MAIASMLVMSCSPRVLTEVTKQYPAVPTDSVIIFEQGDTVPNTAEAIGKVAVKDGGLTVNCQYDRMLGIACQTTAKNGGNGLLVTEHRFPNLHSSCHQVWGTMLRLVDMTVDGHKPNPVMEGNADVYQRSSDRPQNAISRPKVRVPANVFSVSAGPAWIVSKIQFDYYSYSSRLGYDYTLGYEHLFERGQGVGIDFSYHYTPFDVEVDYIKLYYVGPCYVWSIRSASGWRFESAAGIGYSYMNINDDYHESGIGFMCRLGVDYMITKHFGIGVEVNMLTQHFSRPEGFSMADNESYGYQRSELLGGLRYYF